jgi:streptogramin lyase
VTSPARRFATSMALCLGVLLLIGGVTAPTARSAEGDVTMFPLPAGNFPTYITSGPDGNLWFTSPVGGTFVSNVGSITPAGAVTLYPVPTPRIFGDTYGITAGPDGNIWFTEIFGGKIGRVTPGGSITEFTVGGQPSGITAGPDGRLWFGDIFLNRVRSITTSGVLGPEFSVNNPRDVVTGPDGNLWVTELGASAIVRLTPAGSVTRFPLPLGSFGPFGIAAGPDGNVWFTTFEAIGRITPAGAITLFSPPSPGSWPFDIAMGADGNLWFTQRNIGRVGRATPSGVITEFATPAPPGVLSGIASGPDGSIWFTAQDTGEIGRIEVEAVDSTPPVIIVPPSIVGNASSPSGAVVSYSVSAEDDVDGPVDVVCAPSSGSVFPIGTTQVVCTASDAAGNEASASFDVHVKGASEQLDDLLAQVDGLGPGASLKDKLSEAIAELDAGDEGATCEKLNAFANAVQAQSSKSLTPAQAAELLVSANRILAVLAC